jgi:hypothetical protein
VRRDRVTKKRLFSREKEKKNNRIHKTGRRLMKSMQKQKSKKVN